MPVSILKNSSSHHQSIKEHHETAKHEKLDEKDEIENDGKITT
jgi:hypothetical protein